MTNVRPAVAPAAAPRTPHAADPIAWTLFETRGSRPAPGAAYPVTTIGMHSEPLGRALVTDGSLRSAASATGDRTLYLSDELFLRPEADPDAALRASREGAQRVLQAIDRASGSLERFRVAPTGPLPRAESTAELIVRRESGARDRFVVPDALAPAVFGDIRVAADAFAEAVRTHYRPNEPQTTRSAA